MIKTYSLVEYLCKWSFSDDHHHNVPVQLTSPVLHSFPRILVLYDAVHVTEFPIETLA